MASLHEFLDGLGLAKYTQLFLDNDVDDLETLRALTERKQMQAPDVAMSGTHISARCCRCSCGEAPTVQHRYAIFSCEETDLRELNLPVGCRRKLQRALKTQSKPQQQSVPDADVQRQVHLLHVLCKAVQHVIAG